jgi:hypothetical protein
MSIIYRTVFWNLACLFVLAIGSEITYAQSSESLADYVGRCALIETAAERLECFDRVAEPIPAADPINADVRAAAETPVNASAASTEQSLGAEQVPGTDEVDELVSNLVGSFNGWDGNTVFRLDNGQAWQQVDSSYQYARSEGPRVTIRRAAFGSYLLQVEGVGKAVRVRRIE